jgi:hypothetical protein
MRAEHLLRTGHPPDTTHLSETLDQRLLPPAPPAPFVRPPRGRGCDGARFAVATETGVNDG